MRIKSKEILNFTCVKEVARFLVKFIPIEQALSVVTYPLKTIEIDETIILIEKTNKEWLVGVFSK